MSPRIALPRLLAFAIVLSVAGPRPEARADDGTERSLSPYFVVTGAADGAEPLALEATNVHVSISGVVADVRVEQVYRNRGTVPIHARYVFPASTRAAVHGMEMRLGDRRVVARIRERQRAQQEFDAARRSGRTASMLQEERPNVFAMSVANVLPGDRVVVELRYDELLVPTEGTYSFVYPTVVGPRYVQRAAGGGTEEGAGVPYVRNGTTTDTTFAIDVVLASGVPFGRIRSTSHRVEVARTGPRGATVALTNPAEFAADRDFVLDYSLAGGAIETGLLLADAGDEKHFLLMVQPPARVRPEDVPPREYVFVLDVSGSMAGFPLDTAKALLDDLVAQLRPIDSFDVVLFAGDARVFSPRSVPASRANLRRAIAMIDGEPGGGGTELGAALDQVDAIPRSGGTSRSVVVLTDGYIAEERETFTHIADGLSRTNFFAFGIGSSVNRHLIDGLARVGQGEAFVVTEPSQAAATARRFRQYIESPVLTDVQVRYEGFDAYDVEPAHHPDLFASRPVVVVGRWRGERRGVVEVSGATPSGRFVSRIQVDSVAPRPENAVLTTLWARTRIARLSDFAVGEEDAATASAITELGLRYSLLTRHTSFIAVLEEVRNAGGAGRDVNQPSPLPRGVGESAVGAEYASSAEPEFPLLAVILVLLLVLGSGRRGRRSGEAGAS